MFCRPHDSIMSSSLNLSQPTIDLQKLMDCIQCWQIYPDDWNHFDTCITVHQSISVYTLLKCNWIYPCRGLRYINYYYYYYYYNYYYYYYYYYYYFYYYYLYTCSGQTSFEDHAHLYNVWQTNTKIQLLYNLFYIKKRAIFFTFYLDSGDNQPASSLAVLPGAICNDDLHYVIIVTAP